MSVCGTHQWTQRLFSAAWDRPVRYLLFSITARIRCGGLPATLPTRLTGASIRRRYLPFCPPSPNVHTVVQEFNPLSIAYALRPGLDPTSSEDEPCQVLRLSADRFSPVFSLLYRHSLPALHRLRYGFHAQERSLPHVHTKAYGPKLRGDLAPLHCRRRSLTSELLRTL